MPKGKVIGDDKGVPKFRETGPSLKEPEQKFNPPRRPKANVTDWRNPPARRPNERRR